MKRIGSEFDVSLGYHRQSINMFYSSIYSKFELIDLGNLQINEEAN